MLPKKRGRPFGALSSKTKNKMIIEKQKSLGILHNGMFVPETSNFNNIADSKYKFRNFEGDEHHLQF